MQQTQAPPPLADDLMEGAAAMAEFIYGKGAKRRKVYHSIEYAGLPVFRIGSKLCARKSVIMKWIEDQERRASGLPDG